MSTWTALGPTVVAAVVMLDPFAFFQPTVTLQRDDRKALAQGDAFARTLPAPSGNVGIVAVVPLQIDGERLVAWMRDIAALKKSPMVKQIGRFSAVPGVADLKGLTLDDVDVREIAGCNPADCGVKLRPEEIQRVQAAISASAGRTEAVQQAFRQVVVARASEYLAHGRDGFELPAFLDANWPAVSRELQEYPRHDSQGSESFLYWAKDAFGGKPMISVTHVTIVRGAPPQEPEVLVAGRQVFATHYVDAAWSFTVLVRGGSSNYLVYLNQSNIDLLNSWYGGLVRRVVERRLRDEAVDVLNGLRRRLESGNPPARLVNEEE